MNAIQHPACNSTLAPPAGMTEEQCHTLHIYRETDNGVPFVSSFWIPEAGELEHLNQGGSVWFRMMGHTHPPMNLLVSPAGTDGATDTNPPEPCFIITNEHWEALTKERDRLLAWQQQEFDSGDDSLFNVRRLRSYLARWQTLEDVHTNVVPGNGDGEEVAATPESVRTHLKYLEGEWDAAEKRIAKLEPVVKWHKNFHLRVLTLLFGKNYQQETLETIRSLVATEMPGCDTTASVHEWLEQHLTTANRIPSGVCEPLPFLGFPAGRVRIRMRADEPVRILVKTLDGLREFVPTEHNGSWIPHHEEGRNANLTVSQSEVAEQIARMESHPRLPLTEAESLRLLEAMDQTAAASSYDNRELLWRLIHTRAWQEFPMDGTDGSLATEMETRLYPEYDGETVTCEKWGWRTPEGDVVYDAAAHALEHQQS